MNKSKHEKIVSILSENSKVFSSYIARHPEDMDEIAGAYSENPSKPLSRHGSKLELLVKEASEKHDTKRCEEALRRYKYRQLLILSAKYLLQKMDAREFCSLWSRVAEKCCEVAYRFAFPYLIREQGLPVAMDDDGKPLDFKFSVIALGKLGAGELNLSSDIDLLFLYNSDNGHVDGKPESTLNEFASKLAVIITSILSRRDENGFCFRVDSGLRPEGNRGPLANSADAAIRFYESWGSEMERMMLIRAKPIAGSIDLGNSFLSRLKPFIYRKSLDMTSLEKIKETKNKIRQEATKSGDKSVNIKLGDGGIREVEFVVQSIQLIHGGKDQRLITGNTFEALESIRRGKYLPQKQCNQLKEAYHFLRHLENMLQMPEEEQTHTLPADTEQWKKLAYMMGYKDRSERDVTRQLMTDLDKHMGIVKQHFQYMFEADLDRHQMEEAIFTNISTCRSYEEEIDSLAWFKREETKRVQYQDLEESLSASEVSERLSLVAEVIISEAYKLATESLRESYGPPLAESRGGHNAGLSIVGMGKLGGREIDYASDLDIMFIYSDDGMSAGPKKITNQEYFTKLSQRIISLITLPTRYGRAYMIDADLRPSGRAGILVTPLATLKNYHLLEAMLWEKQALIKARTVAGDPRFSEQVQKTITELCYESETGPDLKAQITSLRARMEKEKACETETRYNIKLGPGGLMDIETIVQYLMLKHGKTNNGLRINSTLKAIKALIAAQIIEKNAAGPMLDGYKSLREILSRIRLFSNHATDHLDINSEQLNQIAKSLGFDNKKSLVEKFLTTRKTIRNIYDEFIRNSRNLIIRF